MTYNIQSYIQASNKTSQQRRGKDQTIRNQEARQDKETHIYEAMQKTSYTEQGTSEGARDPEKWKARREAKHQGIHEPIQADKKRNIEQDTKKM